MKPCTVWYRATSKDFEEFNHIEDGHATGDKPTPKHPNQVASWARAEWAADHQWLTDDVPPRVVSYGPEDLQA